MFFNNISGTIRCYDSKISDWLIACGSRYYKIFFFTGQNPENDINEFRLRGELLEGKFLVKDGRTRPEDNNKFKIYEKNADKISGIIRPSPDTQQSHTIKDYLK